MKPRYPLQNRAIELRNKATELENLLWRSLKNSQIEGVKFRRQQLIESYIVDFVSFEKRLILEVDGSQHAEQTEYDEKRDACLRANGFVVLRFWNNEINENLDGVLEVIREHCL